MDLVDLVRSALDTERVRGIWQEMIDRVIADLERLRQVMDVGLP